MLECQRAAFEVPRDVAYLNCASSSPLPRVVRLAGEAGVAAKSAPWAMEGAAIARQADAVRAAAGALIGAPAEGVAIVPSVAYGVATAAANVAMAPGSRVLLVEGEFPSQALVWARRAAECGGLLDVVRRPANGDWAAALLARIQQPGLPPVAVAALTPLHWTDGTLIAIERLLPALRAQGAALVLDATQAAGVMALDVLALGADYAVFPTYKWLLGPYTLAFLYVAPGRQAGMPLEWHGGNHVGGAEPFEGAAGALLASARRFDMGERFNPVSLPMALAGMGLLASWGAEAIRLRLRWLTDAVAERAEALGWAAVPRAQRPPHILGLRPPDGVDVAAVVAGLAAHGVYVADRGGVMRVGVQVFNDEADLERFSLAMSLVSQ